jgi:glycosyltransferase involved in cell wall biosynthesis
MRVGLVIYGSLDTLSGGYLYDRKLVEQLALAGSQVDILSVAWRDYAKHLGDNFDLHWQQLLTQTPVDLLLQDELNHPSLLRTNLSRTSRLAAAALYSETKQTAPRPVVSIVHHLRSSETEHPAPLRLLYREIERVYLNSVDALLYNSRTTAATVARLLRAPKPHHVAFPAADHLPDAAPPPSAAELAARARAEGPLRLLFVGNLIRRKGLHVVLSALSRLPSGFWQLDVVGRTDADSGYTKKIARQCQAFAPGAVRFCGRLSDAELVRNYRTHHALVVPSYEGFGIVYLEAMRFGLPVIAATAGAAHEIVTTGENGFLVAPGDTHTLATCIYQLATNRERLLVMSCAAQARYARHPTWQQSMAGAVAFLTALAAPPAPAKNNHHPAPQRVEP